MLVISENVLWRPLVQDRQGAPTPADIGEILQQGGLSGMTAEATQPFLDGAFGRCRDGLSGELREITCQPLRFGVLDAAIGKVPWFPIRNLVPV